MELNRAENVLNLYDSWWFEIEILKKQKPLLLDSPSSDSEPEQGKITEEKSTTKSQVISPVLIHHNRSMSDLSNMNTASLSPDHHSPPKLLTILSGKEISEFENPEDQKSLEVAEEPTKKKMSSRRRRTKVSESKSLSDLEFEELKGFMDLGFVFSEEDKETSLASIIPGLQRLGKKNKESEDEREEREEERVVDSESMISRPYLSEAWEVFDIRPRRENALMNWRIPASSNEIDMKDNLRWWAHTVASTVRCSS